MRGIASGWGSITVVYYGKTSALHRSLTLQRSPISDRKDNNQAIGHVYTCRLLGEG